LRPALQTACWALQPPGRPATCRGIAEAVDAPAIGVIPDASADPR
jgi:hypothetical protein